MNPPVVHLGADIAQSHIDLFGPIAGLPSRIDNSKKAILALLKKLSRHAGVQIVCEATGGCELALRRACHEAGQPISVLNPRQVRDFARAKGQLAKTDRIDARLLSQYGSTLQPRPTPPVEPALQKLAAYSTRRRQLLSQRSAEKNRLHRADPLVAPSHRQAIAFCDRQIASVDRAIARTISDSARLRAKLAALTAVRGVGTVSASALLAAFPELGALSKNQAAALAGLAPFNRDSGAFRGQRHIHGGRLAVREALYMPALVAAHHNPVLHAFYSRLRSNGKPAKLALTAVMRKLLIHLNSLLKPLALSPT